MISKRRGQQIKNWYLSVSAAADGGGRSVKDWESRVDAFGGGQKRRRKRRRLGLANQSRRGRHRHSHRHRHCHRHCCKACEDCGQTHSQLITLWPLLYDHKNSLHSGYNMEMSYCKVTFMCYNTEVNSLKMDEKVETDEKC
jgi:hypothetical protein